MLSKYVKASWYDGLWFQEEGLMSASDSQAVLIQVSPWPLGNANVGVMMCHHVRCQCQPPETWRALTRTEGRLTSGISFNVGKQTDQGNGLMRPWAWWSWHGDVSPPSWHEWHLLTFLPGSSWVPGTPDMINLFIFPELRGALVRDGHTGLWLVSIDLFWPLIGQHQPHLTGADQWSLPQREAGAELKTFQHLWSSQSSNCKLCSSLSLTPYCPCFCIMLWGWG